MFTEIVLSIFETGVNKSTKYFTYGAFIALIFTLGLMLTFAEFNIHLLVMLLLSTGLLIGLIWFVEETERLRRAEANDDKEIDVKKES